MRKLPCFFFSYARTDHGPILDKFFKALKERVAQKGVLDDKQGEVSFRDIDNIEPGEDWGQELADALAKCLTLVSIFTPWYFNRPYCGKEFKVFLDREGVTYDTDGCARGSRKIVPVLWESWSDLERNELPPAVAKFIQATGGKHEKAYKELGLRGIRLQKGSRGPFADILENIAGVLVDRAKQSPLTPLLRAPSLAQTVDAFHRATPTRKVSEVGPNSLLLAYLTAGANAPSSRASRYGATHPGDWHPFGMSGAGGLYLTVRETAATLQFRTYVEPTFAGTPPKTAELVAALREATTRNVIPLIILDPWFVASAEGETAVKQVLADKEWSGGVIVPVDNSDSDTIALLPKVEGTWQVSSGEEPRILVIYARGTISDFQKALLTALTELEKRMAVRGKVSQLPTGPGPDSTPPLRGPAARHTRD